MILERGCSPTYTQEKEELIDASEILVAVMTAVAIVWLVWAERHSRRNTATQVEKAASQAETQVEQRPESKPRRRMQAA